MPFIDLHTHSNASDGTFAPAEVVRLAKAGGLKAFALTDHDTIDGLAEAMAAGEKFGIEVIPGVEVSARFPGGSMHILGLGIDYRQRTPERAFGGITKSPGRAQSPDHR